MSSIIRTVEARLIEYLRLCERDGGWGTAPGRAPDPESTAWTVIAGRQVDELRPAAERALQWLLMHQRDDGSWVMRNGPEIATWPTLPALLALSFASATSSGFAEAQARATRWTVVRRSQTPSLLQRLRDRLSAADESEERANELDPTLDGFGWAEHTFAWVEPTATAMLALARQPSSPARDDRLRICARLLLDRQAPDGGWNYGNKRVLGVDLPGYPDTTGWATLGLFAAAESGMGGDLPLRQSAERGLAQLAVDPRPVSSLSLALEIIATRAWTGEVRDARLAQFNRVLEEGLEAQELGYPLVDARSAALSLIALRGALVGARH